MLKSKLYKEYFPITEKYTQFSEKEKKILCEWARSFKTDVIHREISKAKQGFVYFPTYDMRQYDWRIMVDMIQDNYIKDDIYLVYLNFILYGHKYNALLSFYIFPVIKQENIKSLIGSMQNNLNDLTVDFNYYDS